MPQFRRQRKTRSRRQIGVRTAYVLCMGGGCFWTTLQVRQLGVCAQREHATRSLDLVGTEGARSGSLDWLATPVFS